MYTPTTVIAALTALDVGIMLAMLYIVGDMTDKGKVVLGTALVAGSILVGYRLLTK
jgi:hypothetical protein